MFNELKMKAIFISDLHFGIDKDRFSKKYAGSNFPNQKKLVTDLVAFCKNNSINLLVICGDLFDSPNPSESDLNYFDIVFTELNFLNIQVFLVSGNHDPFIMTSFWNAHLFPENVVLLNSPENLNGYIYNNINFIGRGFKENPSISGIKTIKNMKNILIYHTGIYGDEISKKYPISITKSNDNICIAEFRKLDFDFIFLGHMHSFFELELNKTKLINCGSFMGQSFMNKFGNTGILISATKNSINYEVMNKWN